MKKGLAALSGLGIGLGTMYFFDPSVGRKRRSLLRDKFVRIAHQGVDELDVIARDFTNRAHGVFAEARYLVKKESVSDIILVERVRATLGHIVSHPNVIDVLCEDGTVNLIGQVLTHEREELLNGVKKVHGVKEVKTSLKDYEGESTKPQRAIFQAPAPKALLRILGGSLALYGKYKRGSSGKLISAAGMALFSKATLNK